MQSIIVRLLAFFTTLALVHSPVDAGDKKPKTQNVIVVTLDGFRFQELFGGADDALMNKQFGGVKDLARLKKQYWRDTPEERRTALMPFFWGEVAKSGQIFGDRARKAPSRLTNAFKFSYPGYSEMFCGFADPNIKSNAKKPNPNLSVLEFLHDNPAYKNRVAVFATWDVFPSIFRSE